MNLKVPGSKSITHRALWLAAQAPGTSHLTEALRSADTEATMRVLRAAGAGIVAGPTGIVVEGAPLQAPAGTLDCGNSGTTLRFALAAFARLPGTVHLTGDGSLRTRPNGPLLAALEQNGATTARFASGVAVRGPIGPGHYEVAGSSQYASALMLALPALDGSSHLACRDMPSRGYAGLTTAVAHRFGIEAAPGDIQGGQTPQPATMTIEGDWSSAAFVLAAAALRGKACTVTNIDLASLQPDRAIVDVLGRFGVTVHGILGEGGVSLRDGDGQLAPPGTVDVSATPDLFPVACVLAAAADGSTTVQGTPLLRAKESDRIAAMARGLERLGIHVVERPDGLTITGPVPTRSMGRCTAPRIDARSDHRIHMAFGVLAAAGVACTVSDPQAPDVSFPGFDQMLEVFA